MRKHPTLNQAVILHVIVCWWIAESPGVVPDCGRNYFGEGDTCLSSIHFPEVGRWELDLVKVYFPIFPIAKGYFFLTLKKITLYSLNCLEHGLAGTDTKALLCMWPVSSDSVFTLPLKRIAFLRIFFCRQHCIDIWKSQMTHPSNEVLLILVFPQLATNVTRLSNVICAHLTEGIGQNCPERGPWEGSGSWSCCM